MQPVTGEGEMGKWVDEYFAAYARHAQTAHPETGPADLARLLGFMSPDIRYEDVAAEMVFIGHEGVRAMGAMAFKMSADMSMVCISTQMDGDQFAFEAEVHGTNTGVLGAMAATGKPLPATGKPFVLRTVTVGRRGSDGKVISHKDYWDAGGYMRQVGLT